MNRSLRRVQRTIVNCSVVVIVDSGVIADSYVGNLDIGRIIHMIALAFIWRVTCRCLQLSLVGLLKLFLLVLHHGFELLELFSDLRLQSYVGHHKICQAEYWLQQACLDSGTFKVNLCAAELILWIQRISEDVLT